MFTNVCLWVASFCSDDHQSHLPLLILLCGETSQPVHKLLTSFLYLQTLRIVSFLSTLNEHPATHIYIILRTRIWQTYKFWWNEQDFYIITSGEGASAWSMLLQSTSMKSWNIEIKAVIEACLRGEHRETWHSRAFSFHLISVRHLHVLLPSVPELGDSSQG